MTPGRTRRHPQPAQSTRHRPLPPKGRPFPCSAPGQRPPEQHEARRHHRTLAQHAEFCHPRTGRPPDATAARGTNATPVPSNSAVQNAPRRHRLAPRLALRFPLPHAHRTEAGPPERSPSRSDCPTILPPGCQANVQPEPRRHERHRRRHQQPGTEQGQHPRPARQRQRYRP